MLNTKKLKAKFRLDPPSLAEQAKANQLATKNKSKANNRLLQPRLDEFPVPFVALKNGPPDNSNRCFANTAVQCLLSSAHIRALLENDGLRGPILDVLRPFYRAEKDGLRDALSTSALVETVKDIALQYPHDFMDGGQHDSFDFLQYIIHGSQDDIKNLFKLKIQNYAKCLECGGPEYSQGFAAPDISAFIKRPVEANSLDFVESVPSNAQHLWFHQLGCQQQTADIEFHRF